MTIHDHSIAVIIPYFGKLPWYFEYFSHSCRQNRSVHFVIITDGDVDGRDLPKNIFIVRKSFNELKQLVKQKLGMNIALNYPYKICDFRPAFGHIFDDLLEGYEFWGMGDIDVVYGNIRKFITSEVLQNYDVISVRHDFLVGYFSLFRNCEPVNSLYKESRDYVQVFTSDEHFCFDESNFAWRQMDDVVTFEQVKCAIDSMTHVVKRLHNQNLIRAYFDVHAIEGLPGNLKWDNGSLVYRGQYEIMVYHMIQFKEVCKGKTVRKVPDTFRISPTRIY